MRMESRMAERRFGFPVLAGLALCGLAVSCTTVPERMAVPDAQASAATLPRFGAIRYWGDEAPPGVSQDALTPIRERHRAAIEAGETVPVHFLALSGGGGDGAFAAGLLNGWSRAGDRPQFHIVTGVSTGAIIAPFAFLGAAYDDAMRTAYTEIGPSDIFRPALAGNLISGPALADAAPLRQLVETYATPDMLVEIAREHRRGRRLLVATTNLDSGRPVIWDMGAIAASGAPDALALFRQVLLASAAIPGLLPAVEIEVVADGRTWREMHVDGSVTSQVFAYQPEVELRRLLDQADFDIALDIYVIRNGRRHPLYEAAPSVWYRVMRRSIDVLLTHQGNADVYRIYYLAQRDGLEFHLAMIPSQFECEPDGEFETEYMRALYKFAFQAAYAGYRWARDPSEDMRQAGETTGCRADGSSGADPAPDREPETGPAPDG